jgi:hypothetical protein
MKGLNEIVRDNIKVSVVQESVQNDFDQLQLILTRYRDLAEAARSPVLCAEAEIGLKIVSKYLIK